MPSYDDGWKRKDLVPRVWWLHLSRQGLWTNPAKRAWRDLKRRVGFRQAKKIRRLERVTP